MRFQNKEEELLVNKLTWEKEGDRYASSKWGVKKMRRALSFLYSFLSKNKQYKVLLVCHMSTSVGLGHLTRLLALAHSLKEHSAIKIKLII